MLLEGKNAVITGCLKGIGRATLDEFAKNGANIWACCQAPDEEFINHIKELQDTYRVTINPIYFDLSNYDEIKAGMKEIISSKQKVDILVNIAGMTYNALFHMTSMEKMKEVFEIDFFSQMLVTQYITKIMKKQKSGSVVSVSSMSAIDGNAGQVAYSAAKAAIIGATKTLAQELAEYNIRVNAVAPGVIKTDMTGELPIDKFENLYSKSNLNRPGDAEEVAKTLAFLSSDMSSYVTGQILRIDGGVK